MPSSARRRVGSSTDSEVSDDPRTTTRLAPCTTVGERTTGASALSPAFDSVSSSSRAMPVGAESLVAAMTAAVVRDPMTATPSHSRNASAARTSGCTRTIPRRASAAARLSRAVSVSCGDAAVTTAKLPVHPGLAVQRQNYPPGRRSPRRAADLVGRPRRTWRIARRSARRSLGWKSQVSGRLATQRLVRQANGMWAR